MNIDRESIEGESGVGVTGGWDSLKQIEVLVEIERAYGIRFRSSQFETLTTVLSIALCVKELIESWLQNVVTSRKISRKGTPQDIIKE